MKDLIEPVGSTSVASRISRVRVASVDPLAWPGYVNSAGYRDHLRPVRSRRWRSSCVRRRRGQGRGRRSGAMQATCQSAWLRNGWSAEIRSDQLRRARVRAKVAAGILCDAGLLLRSRSGPGRLDDAIACCDCRLCDTFQWRGALTGGEVGNNREDGDAVHREHRRGKP